MKLTWKLTLILFIGMCAVLALDVIVELRRERAILETNMRTDEHDTGQALATSLARVLALESDERAREIIEHANASSTELRFRWIDTGADVDSVASVVRGDSFFTYIPIRSGGETDAVLEVSESLAGLRQHLRTLVVHRIGTTLVLAVLLSGVAAVVGAWIVGNPMSRLVAKARRVGEGDLGGPLGLTRHDEIGILAREIDAMCDRLASAQHRLAAETAVRITAIEQLRHAGRLVTVGQLASGLAHELGTPLNVVAQRAKMIATGEVSGQEATDGARIVFEQSQRMTGVLRQLLDFARRRTPQSASYDLRRIAEQTAGLLSPLARKRNVEIRVELGDSVRVHVDSSQIEQVLTNLVVNGLQAISAGGTVTMRVERRIATPPADVGSAPGEHACVEVQDSGHGIPPAIQSRIFEPFFTTKDVGEGTGLGLAVAYGIVREHDGWIAVDSELGRGSRFCVFLPLEAAGGST